MLSYLPLAVCIGITLAANNVNIAMNQETNKDGDTYCPVPLIGTYCGTSSIFSSWKCCGELNTECCLNLNTWVWIVLGLVGVFLIGLFVIWLVRCVLCSNESQWESTDSY